MNPSSVSAFAEEIVRAALRADTVSEFNRYSLLLIFPNKLPIGAMPWANHIGRSKFGGGVPVISSPKVAS